MNTQTTTFMPYLHEHLAFAHKQNSFPSKVQKSMRESILKRRQTGRRFVMQPTIGSYTLDFRCSKLKVGILIQDSLDPSAQIYDELKNSQMESLGITLLKYSSHDIMTYPNLVYVDICKQLLQLSMEMD